MTVPPPLALPIDDCLPAIADAIASRGAAVVEAPPGAGKTTRVPRALLDGRGRDGEIWVLEPRRLPARLAATRVASELGERVGETVGYSVRFDEAAGPKTRLRFMTEGLFIRRMLAAPRLPGVGAVVLDELHERHVATDLALAWLRRLRETDRPDLAVVAMSATFDADPVADFLGGDVVRSEGRMFDVAIEHLPTPDNRPLAAQVAGAVRRFLRDDKDGDLLVFLPGAGEIRRAQTALAELPGIAAFAVLPLHGEMPLEDQARAVRPGERRKIILSTNVAESSVTIDGVTGVIDSGLARMAAHSPWTGLPTLALARISQAAAAQRAGRAGRTRPGRALRLYTRHDFEQRPRETEPEIARADLTEVALTLATLGVNDPDSLAWLDPAPAAAWGAARELLGRLGAVEQDGRLTDVGRRMSRLPVHPRLARLVVEGETRGVAAAAGLAAALIAERDIRLGTRASFGGGPRRAIRPRRRRARPRRSVPAGGRGPLPRGRVAPAGAGSPRDRGGRSRAPPARHRRRSRGRAAVRKTTRRCGWRSWRRFPIASHAGASRARGPSYSPRAAPPSSATKRRASGWSPSTRRSEAPRAAASSRRAPGSSRCGWDR